MELVVRAAAEAIGEIDGEAVVALPMLAELLRRESDGLRLTAIRAIGRFGSQASAHVPELLPFLRSTSPLERSAAAEALGRIGDGNPDSISALLPLLNDAHLVTAHHAAIAIAAQGSAAVPYLVPRLKNDGQRITALEVLIEMGPAAEQALPELLQGISGGFVGTIRAGWLCGQLARWVPQQQLLRQRFRNSWNHHCRLNFIPPPHGCWEELEAKPQSRHCSRLQNQRINAHGLPQHVRS